MIRQFFLFFLAFSLIASPVLADGFFLPWGGKKEEQAAKKPAELLKPKENKSFFGSFFLGKDKKQVVSKPAQKAKVVVALGSKKFEIDPDMLTSKGDPVSSEVELKFVSALRHNAVMQALKQKRAHNLKKLAVAQAEFKKRAPQRAYLTQQVAKAQARLAQASAKGDVYGFKDRTTDSPPALNASGNSKNKSPAKQPSKPSLYVKPNSSGSSRKSFSSSGVFTDY